MHTSAHMFAVVLLHDIDQVDGALKVVLVVKQGLRHALANILAPGKVDDCAVFGALECLVQVTGRPDVPLDRQR